MGIQLQQSFTLITCCNCGCPFAVPADFELRRRESKATFWCPNGHAQSFTHSIADKLRNDLATKERELQHARNREAAALESVKTAERKAKRLSKRLESGVCPHPNCKRHFTNLQRDITTEHHGVALPTAEI